MNVFMMLLVVLFMAGYYFITAPSQTIQKHQTEYAVNRADLRAVVNCATAAHTAVIKDIEFNNICAQKYGVTSTLVCLNESLSIVQCDVNKIKKPKFNFVITSTGILPPQEYNNTIEILEDYYSTINTFGVLIDGFIISGNNSKREIFPNIIESAELVNGQLVYMTQFDIPDVITDYTKSDNNNIECGLGTVKAYRFSRWQCIPTNETNTCLGDTIWDSDLMACVIDESSKPLCADNQTAILVDDIWECVDPISEKICESGEMAKLNYSTLEWECVYDPNENESTKSCDTLGKNIVHGKIGSTLQLSYNSCTDCEKMVVNSETCITTCIPDITKIGNSKCYANAENCTGSNKAFYFGFPDSVYSSNISDISEYTIPFDSTHSRNRMFNCLDCGDKKIDTEKSYLPYIAICEE